MKLLGRAQGPGVLNGFLDKGCSVTGELRFEDTLRLDGSFRGKILSDHELIIGETGDFEGELEVGSVSINGRVRGIVRAAERIEIHPGARVRATLIAPILVVEEGALLEGDVQMGASRLAEPPEAAVESSRGIQDRKVVAMNGVKRRDDEPRTGSAEAGGERLRSPR